jgi:hypothetical protein
LAGLVLQCRAVSFLFLPLLSSSSSALPPLLFHSWIFLVFSLPFHCAAAVAAAVTAVAATAAL